MKVVSDIFIVNLEVDVGQPFPFVGLELDHSDSVLLTDNGHIVHRSKLKPPLVLTPTLSARGTYRFHKRACGGRIMAAIWCRGNTNSKSLQ
jgi:hypothetical protein